ncbi:hybrid sensor histidine kinase/response regulator [Pseudodonghicola flavimaris]|uniref:histidine kinase n=1 Tax=Pseudodonghicola flavimaris TaxID=3050036 RepID=A0ABT7F6C3_9RHOB|nr:PAS domain-containing hybrid sensor histidine kinase/response regulator [Pseudodonghicola flavimaris]MDK3020151.1 ATP-binding protein [Pseudodonghicola flavimaris]
MIPIRQDNTKEAGTTGTPWRRTGATVLTLIFCLGLVSGMALLVLRELDDLSQANSDNLQWSLAQADVEFLRFQLELERARDDPTRLDQVRRRFDIFYSRMTTLERGTVFERLRADPTFDHPRTHLRSFLDSTVPLIDGSDVALFDALPQLARDTRHIADDVRTFSLSGLSAFAQISDERRQHLVQTLLMMAVVLAVLLAGLALLTVSFFRLAKLSQTRAREVQRTAGRLRTIIETALDAIVVTDAEGRIREFNPAARRIFGYTREEARHRSAIDLLFPSDLAESLRDGPLRFLDSARAPEAHEKQIEITAVDRFGRRFPAEISIDLAEDDSGRLFVAYIRDISRRKAAEEGLTVARDRALAGERAKAEFLAVMSHEMRTPLNGLLGSMQLMRDHRLDQRQSELLDRMQSSGRLLLGLVNDVLDLAKFEAGKMRPESRPFSLTRLLDGVVETMAPLAAQNHDRLSWRWVGPPQDAAEGDARRLRQVLLNLAGNAVKFTQGGTVEIEAELLRDGHAVEFRVIDSGIGIAEADLERIFSDFETLDSSYARQAGGTGLGLGIARRLTEMMGGEIGAESEPGEGSLFWLRVPLDPSTEPLPARAVRSTPRPELAPLDLLVVEDNEINRFVAREMLEADGHRVTEASDGRAGVEWAEAQHFDAILMDISMPVMDGTQATQRIRAGSGPCARVPIIAVTAHALPEELARFREAGMTDSISKPIDRAELTEALARVASGELPAAPVVTIRPAPTDPLIDTDQLSTLWAGLGAEASAHLMQSFLAELDEAIPALAATPPDRPDLGPLAHKCAGSCATFGAVALRRALGQVELATKQGTPVAPADLAALNDLWARSRLALEAWHRAA